MKEKPKPEKTLTREEMHAATRDRISTINEEFEQGFEFLEDYPRSVTFFGSARLESTDPYYTQAASLAKRISTELGYSILTGGGPGVMEAANRGAFEARGSSVGVTIQLPHEQITNPFLTDHISLYYFFIRKVCLSFSAETYIFFPGGFGTLDEFFEIITLVQTKKIQSVPIVLFGESYWRPLENFLKEQVVSRKMIDPEDLNLFTITDDENKVLDIIRAAPVRNGVEHYGKRNPRKKAL